MWLGLGLMWACSGAPRTAELSPQPAPEPSQAVATPAAEARRERMGGHFAMAWEALGPMVEGDLVGVRARLSEGAPSGEGASPVSEADRARLEPAVRAVLDAPDAEVPATYARLLATCGDCHAAHGRGPRWPDPPADDDHRAQSDHVRLGQLGVEGLWLGLVGGDSASWDRGWTALREQPAASGEGLTSPTLPSEVPVGNEARALAIGDTLARCGACHATRPR